MDQVKDRWQHRIGERGNRGLFTGLFLIGVGAFWILGRLQIVPEPAEIVFPLMVILAGLAAMFRPQDHK